MSSESSMIRRIGFDGVTKCGARRMRPFELPLGPVLSSCFPGVPFILHNLFYAV